MSAFLPTKVLLSTSYIYMYNNTHPCMTWWCVILGHHGVSYFLCIISYIISYNTITSTCVYTLFRSHGRASSMSTRSLNGMNPLILHRRRGKPLYHVDSQAHDVCTRYGIDAFTASRSQSVVEVHTFWWCLACAAYWTLPTHLFLRRA